MKPGDLRRFHSDGCIFMILEVDKSATTAVTLVVDGKIVGPWAYYWVSKNSEPIDER